MTTRSSSISLVLAQAKIHFQLFPLSISRHMPAGRRYIAAVIYCIPIIQLAISSNIIYIISIFAIGSCCKTCPSGIVSYMGYGVAIAVVSHFKILRHPPLVTDFYR